MITIIYRDEARKKVLKEKVGKRLRDSIKKILDRKRLSIRESEQMNVAK